MLWGGMNSALHFCSHCAPLRGVAFFGVHDVEEGEDVVAVGEAGVGLGLGEAGGGGVAPAALGEEGVPDFDLLGGGLLAVGEGPMEDFIVGAALEGAVGEGVEVDVEELAEAVVEGAVSGDDADVVAGGEVSLGIEADFVEDTGEDDDAAGLDAGTADGEHFF